jgi:hypothetical protein
MVTPFEWFELERTIAVPKLDREQIQPIVFISPEIRGRYYIATGDEDEAIEEILFADIVFDWGSTCPTLFVVWEKKMYLANERCLWYPDPRELR